MSSSWIRPTGLVLLLLLFATLGCSSGTKARAKVNGRVKFFDKYLTCGTVAFTTKDGRMGAGNIDFDGNYEIGDAPVGDVMITVTVPTPPRGPAATAMPKPPPGIPPMQPPGGIGGPATVTFDVSKIVQIPAKYADKDKSNLTYKVEHGEQTHNINLSP